MKQFSRTLGKIESKLLDTLASQDKTIITTSEAERVTGSSSGATRKLLSGLVKKKWLIRLVPGKFLIVPLSAGSEGQFSENWYVVAKSLIEPAPYYISHYSALEIHETTTQPLFTVYINTPKRRQPKEILGAKFQFIYIKPKDIWGIDEIWITPDQKVKVSDLERTIIDCLDRPDLCGGISEIAKAVWVKRDGIDYPKLVEYIKKLGRSSVAKRLGFILETYKFGKENVLSELTEMVSPRYLRLDPTLETSGRYDSKWKLRINIEPEELINITKT
jgi:predicted transcriptional regulator of viral defense system